MPSNTPQKLTPPIPLVQTWCTLRKDRDREIREYAKKMLTRAFGDMKKADEFIKKNNIDVWYD